MKKIADKLVMEAEKIIPDLYEGSETEVIMTPDDIKTRINVIRHSFVGPTPALGQTNSSLFHFRKALNLLDRN